MAEPGFLCVYIDNVEGGENTASVTTPKKPVEEEGIWFTAPGVSPVGALMEVGCKGENEECSFAATWAVTAPEE